MASERKNKFDCEKTLCNCKEFGFTHSIFCSSTADSNLNSDSIVIDLRKLPKVKARPGFDQRMAAAFAMELERETQERNKAWLTKNTQISLPGVTSDLLKDLF